MACHIRYLHQTMFLAFEKILQHEKKMLLHDHYCILLNVCLLLNQKITRIVHVLAAIFGRIYFAMSTVVVSVSASVLLVCKEKLCLGDLH